MTQDIAVLVLEQENYERECAIAQAVADERRRARKEAQAAKEMKRLLWIQRIIGFILLVAGFAAITYIDRELTTYLVVAAISAALIFARRPLLFGYQS